MNRRGPTGDLSSSNFYGMISYMKGETDSNMMTVKKRPSSPSAEAKNCPRQKNIAWSSHMDACEAFLNHESDSYGFHKAG